LHECGSIKPSKNKKLLMEDKIKSNNILNIILDEVSPLIDKIVDKIKKDTINDGKKMSDYDIEIEKLTLLYNLIRAIESYLEPTDELYSMVANQDYDGSIVINAAIIRNGLRYTFVTEAIAAGGYNIQKFHYRYVVKTQLPHKKNIIGGKSSEIYQQLDKLKNPQKYQKLNDRNIKAQKELEKLQNDIIKLQNKVEKNKQLSDEEIKLIYKDSINKMKWENLSQWQRDSWETFGGEKYYKEVGLEKEIDRLVKFWKLSNIDEIEEIIQRKLNKVQSIKEKLGLQENIEIHQESHNIIKIIKKKDLLTEGLTSEVYHFTRSGSLVSILKENRMVPSEIIEVGGNGGADSFDKQKLRKGYGKYYISFSRNKSAEDGYAAGKDFDVRITFNGSKLNNNHYSVQFNFFRGNNDKKDEFEDRMYLREKLPKEDETKEEVYLDNVTKYITRIDICLRKDNGNYVNEIVDLCKQYEIPLYIYDNKRDFSWGNDNNIEYEPPSSMSERFYNALNTKSKDIFIDKFIDGVARVQMGNKWNYINQDKQLLIPNQWFNNVGDFYNGMGKVEVNNSFTFINTKGELIYPNQWFELSDFKNGWLLLSKKGKYNYININGQLISPNLWFDWVYGFNNGVVKVESSNKYNFIDINGKFISDKWFNGAWIGDFKNGFAKVDLDGKKYHIDKEGNLTLVESHTPSKPRIILSEKQVILLKEHYNKLSKKNEVLIEKTIKKKHLLLESATDEAFKKFAKSRGFVNRDDYMSLQRKIKKTFGNGEATNWKFLAGLARIYLDEKLGEDNEKRKDLNTALGYMTPHVNEYDYNLKQISTGKEMYTKDLIEKFTNIGKTQMDKDREDFASRYNKYDKSGNITSNKGHNYEVVPINSHEEAAKYSDYVEWCITQKVGGCTMHDKYTSGGTGRFYFLLAPDYEDIPKKQGPGFPYDEYGLSMIAVNVDRYGNLTHCTLRWNHDDGANDAMFDLDKNKLSEFLSNTDFHTIFEPYNEEEIKAKKEAFDRLVQDALEKYRNGDNSGFDNVGEVTNDGNVVVQLKGKENFITTSGELVSPNQWFDGVVYFIEGVGIVMLNNKYNYINTKGELLSPNQWFDKVYKFKNGVGKVILRGVGVNFINKFGKLMSNKWFHIVSQFEGGFARVQSSDDKYNYINTQGEILSPDQWFDSGFGFRDGFAIVQKDGYTYRIDKEGNLTLIESNTQNKSIKTINESTNKPTIIISESQLNELKNYKLIENELYNYNIINENVSSTTKLVAEKIANLILDNKKLEGEIKINNDNILKFNGENIISNNVIIKYKIIDCDSLEKLKILNALKKFDSSVDFKDVKRNFDDNTFDNIVINLNLGFLNGKPTSQYFYNQIYHEIDYVYNSFEMLNYKDKYKQNIDWLRKFTKNNFTKEKFEYFNEVLNKLFYYANYDEQRSFSSGYYGVLAHKDKTMDKKQFFGIISALEDIIKQIQMWKEPEVFDFIREKYNWDNISDNDIKNILIRYGNKSIKKIKQKLQQTKKEVDGGKL
jgi:hypothetical protein